MPSSSIRLLLRGLLVLTGCQYAVADNTDPGYNIACNKTFDSPLVNASMIRTFDAPINDTRSLPVGYAVSMSSLILPSYTKEWYDVWFWANGANLSNSASLGYDICAFDLSPLPNSTIARGQDDTGDCLATFDQQCVDAINTAAESYAVQLFQPSPLSSSGSQMSFQTACQQLASNLTANMPLACSKYVLANENTRFQPSVPLTKPFDNTPSILESSNCTMTDTTTNATYKRGYEFITFHTGANRQEDYTKWYDTGIWLMVPLVTVFTPQINMSTSSIGDAKSIMNCMRAKNINSGSQNPGPFMYNTTSNNNGTLMLSGTSSPQVNTTVIVDNAPSNSALSGGAIAGIVVGVVFGWAVISLVAIFFSRRAKQRKQNAGQDHGPWPQAEMYEDKRMSELDGTAKNELDYSPDPGFQAAINFPPVELHGSAPAR